MLDIITRNPFRVLGVFSNARSADIIRNLGKMKAYLNVGKVVDYPSDMKSFLSMPNRTLQNVQDAQTDINLPKDKIKYGLFWFCNVSPIDESALNNLANGDIEKAKEILSKRESFSSLVNLAVINLIQNNVAEALQLYSKLIHNFTFRVQFVATVCDDTFQISESNLMEIVIGELLKISSPKILISVVSDQNDLLFLKQKAIEDPLSLINSEIAKAKSVSASDADSSYRAGKALIRNTKTALADLKSLLGPTDMQFQSISDNLAKQILQCGINYYNNTDDDNDIDNALEIQEYALKVAVGKLTKDRCQQNVKILKEKKEREAYEAHVVEIAEQLKLFNNALPSIDRARIFINKCKPHLNVLKQKLGSTNDLYLKISSAVANNALGMLISVVNTAQQRGTDISELSSKVQSALDVMLLIGDLDMSYEEKSRYNKNRTALVEIASKIVRIETARNYTPQRSSSGGCYIATMVYGDYDHPQVMILREFRDTVLKNSILGRAFIKFYYRYSPTWVEHLKDKKSINDIIRNILDKFIKVYKNEKN